MTEHFLSRANYNKFVEKLLQDSEVVAPVEEFGKPHIQEITSENIGKIQLSGFRTVEPFKSYFFKLAEKVSEDAATAEKLTILGARACDLGALEILDKVLTEGEFIDPFYVANREQLTVISSDCTDCGDTCFCTLVKGKPYAAKFFDLNLCPHKNGYVVEVGSSKGEKLITENKELFSEVAAVSLEDRTKNRQRVTDLLAEKNKNYNIKLDLAEIHKRNLENKEWSKLTKDCVECSACNFICPSCTCFLLLDQADGRYKVWDGCLKAGYARVAGDANPRGKLYERLQNRYHCKFDYSFDRLKRFTCVGCGRCIDGCAGKIDMRKVFVELEKQVPLMAKLK